jgi:hypothetical protein
MLRSVVEQKRQAELRDALKESLWSAVPGLEDRTGGEANQPLISPALSSPALEPPASSSPAPQAPTPSSPPAPAGEPKEPKANPSSASSAGWTLVIERRPALQ